MLALKRRARVEGGDKGRGGGNCTSTQGTAHTGRYKPGLVRCPKVRVNHGKLRVRRFGRDTESWIRRKFHGGIKLRSPSLFSSLSCAIASFCPFVREHPLSPSTNRRGGHHQDQAVLPRISLSSLAATLGPGRLHHWIRTIVSLFFSVLRAPRVLLLLSAHLPLDPCGTPSFSYYTRRC